MFFMVAVAEVGYILSKLHFVGVGNLRQRRRIGLLLTGPVFRTSQKLTTNLEGHKSRLKYGNTKFL